MTIKQAIAELREATKNGEKGAIESAYAELSFMLVERYGDHHVMRYLGQLDTLKIMVEVQDGRSLLPKEIEPMLTALASSVEGGTVEGEKVIPMPFYSPTPSLTDRIAAAAEEIERTVDKVLRDGLNLYEKQTGIFIPVQVTNGKDLFTAIITRHIQGGK